jgi:hypothetical protein
MNSRSSPRRLPTTQAEHRRRPGWCDCWMCFSGTRQNTNSLSPTVGISAAIVDLLRALINSRCSMFLRLRSVFNRVFLPSRAARKHLGPVVIENLPFVSEVQTRPCSTLGRVALVSWPAWSVTPVLSSRPPTLTRKPPIVLSPFARCRGCRQGADSAPPWKAGRDASEMPT